MDPQILIVDDDVSIRESMNEFIGISGYVSFAAETAEDALEILSENSIQVVVTDILLPGMDGLELTDRIKHDYDIDVIVMTGYSTEYSYEEAIGKGASDFVFKPVRFEELLLRLKRVLKERKLARERLDMMARLQKLSITDGLTQLYNSRHFYNQLKAELDRSNRYGHPLSLLLLDIDEFKVYNDTYGHLDGDQILIGIGRLIKECLRKMDSAYRYGGEEFTILLPETVGEEARTVAERLRASVCQKNFCSNSGNPVNITISIGVTEYVQKETISDFVQRADKAMYTSKQNGRNQVSCIYSSDAN